MQVYVYDKADTACKAAATIFASTLLEKPDAIFGLATGSTPVPLYQELARMNHAGLIDFSNARSWNLDEYVGLKGDHPASFRYFMDDNLFHHINIPYANTHVPCGVAPDMKKEAANYDKAIIEAGGIDLQLLGIGENGHIGFNEPGKEFVWETHTLTLTESTRIANSRFFDKLDDVPSQAITMGIGNIMQAKRVVFLAFGAKKAQAVKEMVNGSANPGNQSTILRMHRNVQVFLDKEAASLL